MPFEKNIILLKIIYLFPMVIQNIIYLIPMVIQEFSQIMFRMNIVPFEKKYHFTQDNLFISHGDSKHNLFNSHGDSRMFTNHVPVKVFYHHIQLNVGK